MRRKTENESIEEKEKLLLELRGSAVALFSYAFSRFYRKKEPKTSDTSATIAQIAEWLENLGYYSPHVFVTYRRYEFIYASTNAERMFSSIKTVEDKTSSRLMKMLQNIGELLANIVQYIKRWLNLLQKMHQKNSF